MSTTASEVRAKQQAGFAPFSERFGVGQWAAREHLSGDDFDEASMFRIRHPEIQRPARLVNGYWRVEIPLPSNSIGALYVSAKGHAVTLDEAYDKAKLHFVTLSIRGY